MSNLVAKCGIDCGACPWGPYPREGMTLDEFEKYRNDVKRILGYMPIKTPCLTCQTPDDNIPKTSKLPNRKCLIRRCVDKTGLANCAYCSAFPCDTVKATAGAWNRESIEAKLDEPLSEEAYHWFVEPFEGLKRLEAIHASLKPDEIREPAKTPAVRTGIVDFPKNLPFSKEKVASFKAVHKLLTTLNQSSLGLTGTDTFAQQQKLENLRAHVYRFLWVLGNFGEFEEETNKSLVVGAETYLANRGKEKTLAIWSFVEDTVFKVLSAFGVCCERVPLQGVNTEDLTTGTGYLRSKGWIMWMAFEEKIGGSDTLNALQTYVKRIDKKYGAKAFHYFQNTDMRSLLET